MSGMHRTRSNGQNGFGILFDESTGEAIETWSPVVFYDDFLGAQVNKTVGATGDGVWATVETNLNTAIGTLDGQAHGVVQLPLDSDSNAERAVLYFGDVRGFDLKSRLNFEARVKLSALPTSGTSVIMGLAGDDNSTADSIAEHAWFRVEGADNDALLVETDDTTNNNDDTAAGAIAVDTWYRLGIDCTDIEDVRFYLDGERVASGTTFDMSNLTDAEALMQPYFAVQKGSGTSVGTLLVDCVRVWSARE